MILLDKNTFSEWIGSHRLARTNETATHFLPTIRGLVIIFIASRTDNRQRERLVNLLPRTTGLVGGIVLFAVYWMFAHLNAEPDSVAIAKVATNANNPLESKHHSLALGVTSCAAAACHGNPNSSLPSQGPFRIETTSPEVSWKSSYYNWANLDPHARAFRTLQLDRSNDIMRRLKRNHSATVDKDCLACHANPTLAARTDNHSRALHAQGVSCEACHGNAAPWLNEHVAWTALTPREHAYESAGMTTLFDLGVRAKACAGCHVGAPADSKNGIPLRDVNHDMIAAGHPRLTFEFATWSRMLPPHWREKDRKQNAPRSPGFEAQFWLNGQMACVESSLELLQARAKSPHWPELAEFSCYACHHDLKPEGWRGPHKFGEGRKLGSLHWNRPDSFGALAKNTNFTEARNKLDAIDNGLRVSLGSNLNVLNRSLADALPEWRGLRQKTSLRSVDETLANGLDLLRHSDAFWKQLDWDQSARLYYSIVAIQNARRHRNQGPLVDEAKLLELRKLLMLPREPNRFDSPKTFVADQVRETLRQLLDTHFDQN